MSYRTHAERELVAVGYDLNDQEDGPNKWIMENLFELLDVFERQGHSGMSAPYCISMFEKLASFKPLGPLTGEDHEWVDVGNNMWQNNRCSHVFKDETGKAYDSEGRIFREPDGGCYTGAKSKVDIVFPYTPVREYIDVDLEGNPTREGKYGVDLIAEELEHRINTSQKSTRTFPEITGDKLTRIKALTALGADIAEELNRLQKL